LIHLTKFLPNVQCARQLEKYCKTLYFRCILISRFWNVEISLHFNLVFSQCSTSIYQAFGGQTEFSWVFNFAFYSTRKICRNLLHTKNMFYSICQGKYKGNIDHIQLPVDCVKLIIQEAQLPLRNRTSATYFFVAKLISIV